MFNGQKAGYVFVGLWIFQVYFLVRGVKISADKNGFLFPQSLGVFKKGIVIAQFERQPLVIHLAVREIDIEQVKVRVFKPDKPTLSCKRAIRQPRGDAKRGRAKKTGRAGVAFFGFGRIPK